MDEKIIKIDSFFDYTKAEITKIALEAEGIDCFLSGENFVATYWLYANADRGIKLYIKESDKQQALEILKNIRQPKESEADPNYDLKCPRCDSTDIDYEKYSRWAFFFSMVLFRLPVTFLRRKYKCTACGNKWKE